MFFCAFSGRRICQHEPTLCQYFKIAIIHGWGALECVENKYFEHDVIRFLFYSVFVHIFWNDSYPIIYTSGFLPESWMNYAQQIMVLVAISMIHLGRWRNHAMSLEDRNYWNFGPLPESSRKVIKLKCPHNVKKNREIQLKFIINQLTYSLWNGTTHAKINLITLSTSNARQQLIAYIYSVYHAVFFCL